MKVAREGANLVRKLEAGAEGVGQGQAPYWDPPLAQVEAEGLPNLLHELVHAVQSDGLTDDHGIDYSLIPFNLDTAGGRTTLWEELACCTISCAYLWAHSRQARSGADPRARTLSVGAWFFEQLEILPVFFGMEDQPGAFLPRIQTLLRDFDSEASAVLDRAYMLTERALLNGGACVELAVAPRRFTPVQLMGAGQNPWSKAVSA